MEFPQGYSLLNSEDPLCSVEEPVGEGWYTLGLHLFTSLVVSHPEAVRAVAAKGLRVYATAVLQCGCPGGPMCSALLHCTLKTVITFHLEVLS